MIVASADGASSPDALHRAGKPVVLVQGGIHAGEIDGKDAGMMLLRDMTVRGTRRELLARASLLFVPILNVAASTSAAPRTRAGARTRAT
jgi:predicted deacylase